MYNIFITIGLSLMAGIHAASYGAWKDSPSESYLLRRSIREMVIALCIGIVLSFYKIWQTESYLIIYLSTYTLNRLVTEFYKLFIRTEPQDHYRIPTQIHWFGTVLESKVKRLLFGLYAVIIVTVVYLVGRFVLVSFNWQLRGIITGLLIGFADAHGGAYKDGSIEGFYIRKFIKSPSFGILGGLLISWKTSSPLFLLFGSIAVMRMLIELLFKILSKGYVPGKFQSLEPVYPKWKTKRKIFLIPYFGTWILFLVLLITC